MNCLTGMGLEQGCREVPEGLGLALEEAEWEAGLGDDGRPLWENVSISPSLREPPKQFVAPDAPFGV